MIHNRSRTIVDKDLGAAPGSHNAQESRTVADTGVATSNANNQEQENGRQDAANRKVVLDEIEVECSPEGASDLDGLILAVFSLEGEESAALKKISATTCSWPAVITLRPNMDKLTFIVRSKDGGELGHISLNKDEIRRFLAVQVDTEDKREFQTHKAGLSLQLTFTISIFELDERTAAYSSEEIERMVKDTAENPASSPSVLAELANKGPDYLYDFGIYFTHRFEETGKTDDINHAIEAYELAMKQTSPNDPAHANYMHAAGTGYLSRYSLSGNTPDIEQALSFLELSASRSKEGDTALPERLSRLGIAFRTRFKATGDLVDIENAISNQQRGVWHTGSNHPDLAARLGSLGNSFKARFDRKGDLSDINSAIDNTERAIEISPERHEDMPMWLNNVGSFYQMRFNRTGMIEDSDNGIIHQQRAIDLTPKRHPKMAAWLNNLSCSYEIRFGRTKEAADIEKAIELQTQAVGMTRESDMLKPMCLRNLGISYHAKFRATGHLVDIDNAIKRHKQAVELTPEGHADLSSRLGALGTSFHRRFKHSADKIDVFNAIASFRRAATHPTGRPSTRLSTAREWGLLCRQHQPHQSLEAFRVAIELLSQVAGLEQTVQKRHRSLMDISDLTMSAAAAAMDQNESGTAVEWLEQGRCLVWSQMNQLRTPADRLQVHDPELAERFLRVARALEESGSRQEANFF
ncbi:hypothetical protein NLJ89_g4425 [Agrocybe chaxingu]|uniref:Uncharacterized protein n=1 Tax=Agrocybe chaxingu TaxID=84603 RepID=A0A9W8K343_9AGAR|nr:hypothetical protein NLJ89_g4425 [Agrocybe chaxingu]